MLRVQPHHPGVGLDRTAQPTIVTANDRAATWPGEREKMLSLLPCEKIFWGEKNICQNLICYQSSPTCISYLCITTRVISWALATTVPREVPPLQHFFHFLISTSEPSILGCWVSTGGLRWEKGKVGQHTAAPLVAAPGTRNSATIGWILSANNDVTKPSRLIQHHTNCCCLGCGFSCVGYTAIGAT